MMVPKVIAFSPYSKQNGSPDHEKGTEMATPKSTTAKKPATTRAAAAKPAAAPKKTTTPRKSSSSKTKAVAPSSQISAEERYRMVEVAAYFLAERNGFAGSPVEYWTAAEAQIDKLLSK